LWSTAPPTHHTASLAALENLLEDIAEWTAQLADAF
jgi:hypothetical protein